MWTRLVGLWLVGYTTQVVLATAFSSHPPLTTTTATIAAANKLTQYPLSATARHTLLQRRRSSSHSVHRLRGGEQHVLAPTFDEQVEDQLLSTPRDDVRLLKSSPLLQAAILPMSSALLHSLGSTYATYLQRRPIFTKSVTAGIVFALSDVLAQRLGKTSRSSNSSSRSKLPQRQLQWSRILVSAAVGFFYFGPAAHYWYDWIFRLLPGTSLVSTLQKALLGQMLFGPTFTCVFFATSLMQSGTFSLSNWFRKIRTDLPGAWLAGASFWPLVDLVSYSLIAPQWIPLFVNLCSLVWTTYLGLKSYS